MKYMKSVIVFNYSFGKPRMTARPKFGMNGNKSRTTWISKFNYNAYLSFNSLRACTTDFWYVDSGCSKHER